jgi:predicted Fe-S protein YdhL (DUF1289 family)
MKGSDMIPLNQISVATPCHESWEGMTGDDKKRFCAGCRKHVYNLSAMTEAEAQAVLKIDQPCVRFYRRMDGTVLTQDCPVGVRRVRLRIAAAVSGALAAIVGALSGGRQALADPTMGAPAPPTMGGITAPKQIQPPPPVMGSIVYVPPKPAAHRPLMGKIVAPKPPTPNKSHTPTRAHKPTPKSRP